MTKSGPPPAKKKKRRKNLMGYLHKRFGIYTREVRWRPNVQVPQDLQSVMSSFAVFLQLAT
jgi:hypothetical protein